MQQGSGPHTEAYYTRVRKTISGIATEENARAATKVGQLEKYVQSDRLRPSARIYAIKALTDVFWKQPSTRAAKIHAATFLAVVLKSGKGLKLTNAAFDTFAAIGNGHGSKKGITQSTIKKMPAVYAAAVFSALEHLTVLPKLDMLVLISKSRLFSKNTRVLAINKMEDVFQAKKVSAGLREEYAKEIYPLLTEYKDQRFVNPVVSLLSKIGGTHAAEKLILFACYGKKKADRDFAAKQFEKLDENSKEAGIRSAIERYPSVLKGTEFIKPILLQLSRGGTHAAEQLFLFALYGKGKTNRDFAAKQFEKMDIESRSKGAANAVLTKLGVEIERSDAKIPNLRKRRVKLTRKRAEFFQDILRLTKKFSTPVAYRVLMDEMVFSGIVSQKFGISALTELNLRLEKEHLPPGVKGGDSQMLEHLKDELMFTLDNKGLSAPSRMERKDMLKTVELIESLLKKISVQIVKLIPKKTSPRKPTQRRKLAA